MNPDPPRSTASHTSIEMNSSLSEKERSAPRVVPAIGISRRTLPTCGSGPIQFCTPALFQIKTIRTCWHLSLALVVGRPEPLHPHGMRWHMQTISHPLGLSSDLRLFQDDRLTPLNAQHRFIGHGLILSTERIEHS